MFQLPSVSTLQNSNDIKAQFAKRQPLFGVDFRILAPRQLHPSGDLVSLARSIAMETGAKITIIDNRAEALEGADAIYTDVWV